MSQIPWWEGIGKLDLGSRNNQINWFQVKCYLAAQAIQQGGPPVGNYGRDGNTDTSFDDILKFFEDLGGRTVLRVRYKGKGQGGHALLVWPDGAVEVMRKNSGHCELNCVHRNQEIRRKAADYISSIVSAIPPKGSIHTIVHDDGHTYLRRVGLAGVDFEAGNYAPDVVEGYNAIITDLKSNEPSGRLAIIDGPPGTGKTYMIRALLNDTQNATFVLLPPGMASELTGPALLPVLLNAHDEDEPQTGNYHHFDEDQDNDTEGDAYDTLRIPKKRLVLIMEDADAALVPRGSDNMGLISAMLNLSDGILGHMLDMRIIATTNAKHQELDPAIMRPGRLMARVNVAHLDAQRALQILQRLCPTATERDLLNGTSHYKPDPALPGSMGFHTRNDETAPKNKYLLAEIYDLAHRLQQQGDSGGETS